MFSLIIINVCHLKANTYRLPVSKCDYDKTNDPQTFSVAVRAVNLNPHDSENPYYGPWSAPGSTSCVLIGMRNF